MPVTINGSGGLTFNDGSSQNTAALPGMRNRIINGDMRIDQRNNGAAVTINNAGIYSVDRFYGDANGFGIYTAQRSTVAPAGFTNSALLTVTTARSSIAAGDVYGFRQWIEGFNAADLGWGAAGAKSATLSFWVRSSITGTYAVSFFNAAFNRSYVATYTVNAANTFEFKTITIAGDTTGTWLKDNGQGIGVLWDLGSGSTYNGASANSWLATGSIRVSGSTNWISTNGATFYITGVQLEAGSVATPFENRHYGQELALCQRYLPKWHVDASGGNQHVGSLYWQNTQLINAVLVNPVTTRVPVTGIAASGTFYAQANAAAYVVSTPTFTGASITTTLISTNSNPSSLSPGFGGSLFLQGATSYIYGTGCEL